MARGTWRRWGVMGAWAGFWGCAANSDPVRVLAVVREAEGVPGMTVGQACTVDLRPDWRQGVNCHVSVVCGGVSLFGGTRIGGYAVCETEDHRFTRADDPRPTSRDGDPVLELAMAERRVRVADDRPGSRVVLEVLPGELATNAR